jgi:hypothetical protein
MGEIAGCLGYVQENESLANLKDQLFDKQQEFIDVISKRLKSEPTTHQSQKNVIAEAGAEVASAPSKQG